MTEEARRGRPKKSARVTTPRQFRLGEETLAEMDYLMGRLALRSRADVIRFLVRRATQEERKKEGR